MKRPIAPYWLSFFLLFLAFGGLYGGIAMLLDPSGGSLDMAGILPLLPVSSFVLPGLFVLVGMGLTPIALVYALLAWPKWDGLARWLGRNGRYWAWNATLILSANNKRHEVINGHNRLPNSRTQPPRRPLVPLV